MTAGQPLAHRGGLASVRPSGMAEAFGTGRPRALSTARRRAPAARGGPRDSLARQAGFTLLELTVVAAILGVLAGIVALAVSGQARTGSGTALLADVAEVQKAVEAFSGGHPDGRYPTLNGCLPGGVLDLVTRQCARPDRVTDPSRTNTENLEFEVQEVAVGRDLNGDGDVADAVRMAPIIWAKAFRDARGEVRRLAGGHVAREPKHAFEFLAGQDPEGGWRDGRATDPDGLGDISPDPNGTSTTITAPEGLGSGDNKVDVALSQYPVWLLDAQGTVHNILSEGRY